MNSVPLFIICVIGFVLIFREVVLLGWLLINRTLDAVKAGGWTQDAEALTTTCSHAQAIEVLTDNDLDRDTLVAWWCAACGTQLDAAWTRPVAGPRARSGQQMPATRRRYTEGRQPDRQWADGGVVRNSGRHWIQMEVPDAEG